MNSDPPVNFVEKLASKNDNYPYSISASDLMENFTFATMAVPNNTPSGIENAIGVTLATGTNGKTARSIYFKPTPHKDTPSILVSEYGKMFFSSAPADANKIYILACIGGKFQWIETEEC